MGGGKGKKKKQEKQKKRPEDSSKQDEDLVTPSDCLEDQLCSLDVQDDELESDEQVKSKPKGKESSDPMPLEDPSEAIIDTTTDSTEKSGAVCSVEEKKISRKEMKKQKKKVCLIPAMFGHTPC